MRGRLSQPDGRIRGLRVTSLMLVGPPPDGWHGLINRGQPKNQPLTLRLGSAELPSHRAGP
jgi:hypothetical protein